jgi:hypothetical protein
MTDSGARLSSAFSARIAATTEYGAGESPGDNGNASLKAGAAR